MVQYFKDDHGRYLKVTTGGTGRVLGVSIMTSYLGQPMWMRCVEAIQYPHPAILELPPGAHAELDAALKDHGCPLLPSSLNPSDSGDAPDPKDDGLVAHLRPAIQD